MKMLIVITSFLRWINDSSPTFILEAAQDLQSKDHIVRVLAMHAPKSKMQENRDSIEIFRPRYLFEKWEILQTQDGGSPEAWIRNIFPVRSLFLSFSS